MKYTYKMLVTSSKLILCGCVVGALACHESQHLDEFHSQSNLTESEEPHEEQDSDVELAAMHQTPNESEAEDLALIAKESGLNVEVVRQSIAFLERFAAYTDEMKRKYPQRIAASWVERLPAKQGHLSFVGTIPADATSNLGRYSLGVDRVSL